MILSAKLLIQDLRNNRFLRIFRADDVCLNLRLKYCSVLSATEASDGFIRNDDSIATDCYEAFVLKYARSLLFTPICVIWILRIYGPMGER